VDSMELRQQHRRNRRRDSVACAAAVVQIFEGRVAHSATHHQRLHGCTPASAPHKALVEEPPRQVLRRAVEPEALFGSDGDDDDGAMDDDFGGALGDLSGSSDLESDAAPAQQNELLSDGDGEDAAAGDEFGGSEDDDDDEDGLAGGMDGDTSDDGGEEGAEAARSGSEEELETRAERQSRRLDKLKCAGGDTGSMLECLVHVTLARTGHLPNSHLAA